MFASPFWCSLSIMFAKTREHHGSKWAVWSGLSFQTTQAPHNRIRKPKCVITDQPAVVKQVPWGSKVWAPQVKACINVHKRSEGMMEKAPKSYRWDILICQKEIDFISIIHTFKITENKTIASAKVWAPCRAKTFSCLQTSFYLGCPNLRSPLEVWIDSPPLSILGQSLPSFMSNVYNLYPSQMFLFHSPTTLLGRPC